MIYKIFIHQNEFIYFCIIIESKCVRKINKKITGFIENFKRKHYYYELVAKANAY